MHPDKQRILPLYQTAPSPLPPLRPGEILALILQTGFLLLAVLLLLQGQRAYRELAGNIAITFLALLLEALPFMAMGSLAGGLIEVFVPASWIERIFTGRGRRGVLLAGALGLLLPVCECAIVPVVRRLLGKGIPFSAAITFLLAGPIVNPIVAASTAVAYQYSWPVIAVRLGSGYLIAVIVGLFIGRLFKRESGLLPVSPASAGGCGCGHAHGHRETGLPGRLVQALEHGAYDFLSVSVYLVIGAFLAAVTRSTVSMETFAGLMVSPWLAIVLMMVLAMALNLCSEADAFLAASFQGLLPASSQLAFMVLGPMLDIKLIIMYLYLFRKRVIATLAVCIVSGVFLVMLAVENLQILGN